MWKPISIKDMSSLIDAREQLHQASQIVAAVGRTYSAKVKDDHFANLGWDASLEMLKGNPIQSDNSFSAALDLKNLAIHFLDDSNETIGSFPLNGKTQKQAFIWLEEQLVRSGFDGGALTMKLPYEIPVYPTSKGKEFNSVTGEAFEEISNYFSNTSHLLSKLLPSEPSASEIRCWPHHFDIATLITLNDTGDPETSTSVGVGLSPGDEGYNEPYFYLTPWPYPPTDKLPELNGPGHWHTHNWVGGVLTGSEILENTPQNDHEEAVMAFISNGIKTLKSLLSH